MGSEDIQFEKAIEKLERIVEELESGEVALEQALAKYEEGVKLSRLCQGKLAEAEKKVEILTRTLSGELSRQPFDPENESAGETKKTASRKSPKGKSAASNGEDDILL
jgi:exodeoxyribonuclease VII small subunit